MDEELAVPTQMGSTNVLGSWNSERATVRNTLIAVSGF